jgi:hypothetical protein
MRKVLLLCVLCTCMINIYAQKQSFDLATFTPPKGWKKQPNENAMQFSIEDTAKGTYCLIILYKTMKGTAVPRENFDLAWTSLVKEMVTVSGDPQMQDPEKENGWETQSGYAPFESDAGKGVVLLITATASDKMMNMLILTNTDAYEKNVSDFLGSITLQKQVEPRQSAPANNNHNAAVIGLWGVSSTTASFYNTSINEGSIIAQYTFKANGTYSFYIKTFQYSLDKLLLTRETGTYQVNGNNITIIPQKSATEAWSKKNGTDEWGKLLSSQPRELEKVTYQYSTQDFGLGMVLILKAAKPTKRDGPFNNNEKDSWFYPAKSAIEVIKLPGEQVEKETATKSPDPGGFKYTTTNFDDGWTSTVQEDWVEVTKGDIKVLLHYPNNKINPVNTDLPVVCQAAWNALVAPRYSNIENYKVTPSVIEYERPYYAEANLTDNQTGKKVFVALFKQGISGWIEIITADKNSFVNSFGLDISKIDYYADSKIWYPLQSLRNYNKFAVAASDFKGKWSSSYTGTLQYVNIYTGNSAGMNTHSSSEVFEFTGTNYAWELKVASGFVGNIKFQGVKSNGKFSLLNNWQVHFSEIEKKARTYNAYFSCVKGARLLWLQDAAYGDYRSFGKVE